LRDGRKTRKVGITHHLKQGGREDGDIEERGKIGTLVERGRKEAERL